MNPYMLTHTLTLLFLIIIYPLPPVEFFKCYVHYLLNFYLGISFYCHMREVVGINTFVSQLNLKGLKNKIILYNTELVGHTICEMS